MDRKELVILSVLATLLAAAACQEKESTEMKAEPKEEPVVAVPAVYGVVQESPPRGMPPKQAPTPGALVPGAAVALREFAGKEEPAGTEIARTVTDSRGAFRLEVTPGTYFLVVTGAQIQYAQYTTGYMGKNFAHEDSVQIFRIIELAAGELQLNLILPQAWPE